MVASLICSYTDLFTGKETIFKRHKHLMAVAFFDDDEGSYRSEEALKQPKIYVISVPSRGNFCTIKTEVLNAMS
jgi:hypothetical protein